MRKLLFIFLLLPCMAFSQTATILEMHVRKIPLTSLVSGSCQKQKVLLYFEKGLMGVKTYDDTLQLRRIRIVESEAGRSVVYCLDEMHGNRPYSVTYLNAREGLALFITPLYPHPERMTIILSSKPCN